MTIHYHGTPITPNDVIETLAGRHFCVSNVRRDQIKKVHEIGQSVMIDNGAYSIWRSKGKVINPTWDKYYKWVEKWLHYPTTWAVIPDVIDGTEEENDALIEAWPLGDKGYPVWHINESLDRLQRLCDNYTRVCIGSTSEYGKMLGSDLWHTRMTEAMDRVCVGGNAPTQFHMLRGFSVLDAGYPFYSADSTDVARSHQKHTALKLADRWDAVQCVPRWKGRLKQERMNYA